MSNLTPKYVTGFWKAIPLGTWRICGETQLKSSAIILHNWQLLNFLVVKFHADSFFQLEMWVVLSDHVVNFSVSNLYGTINLQIR